MEKVDEKKSSIRITNVLDIIICLLLILASLYKGEFYKADSLFITMIICMLGLACLGIKIFLNVKNNSVVSKSKLVTIIDACMIALPVAYFLPVFLKKSASMESGIFETIRYINLSIIYFIVRSTKDRKIYIVAIVAIGVILAILGIDEITFRVLEGYLKNIGVSYLENVTGNLSSTLQYANITALLMLIASIYLNLNIAEKLSEYIEKKRLPQVLGISFKIFAQILLQTAVILTNSRMNAFLLLVTVIIFCIYNLFKKSYKEAIVTILIFIASCLLVKNVDDYLLKQDYLMIYISYGVTLLLTLLISFITNYYITDKKIQKIPAKKLRIIYISIAIILVSSIAISILPKALEVSASKEQNIVSRYIYGNFEGKKDIELNVEASENSEFKIYLSEINSSFVKSKILELDKTSFINDKYVGQVEVSRDAIKLSVDVYCDLGSVTINDFVLDNKKITLSYLIVPDTVMFKIKDTFFGNTNNLLRYTYYGDALKLFKLSPVIGSGGEAFKARYQEVQNQAYVSSEVHSVPLQILVESGLVGEIIFVSICMVTFLIGIKLLKFITTTRTGLIYLTAFLVLIITSTFDLVFSFGIMMNIFAVIIGLIVNEYKQNYETKKSKDIYSLDNKSMLSMVKLGVLSVSFIVLLVATIYSINMYRASMLVIPKAGEDHDLSKSYETIGVLEEKAKLDKYNLAYMSSLLEEYDKHIDLLSSAYIHTTSEEEKVSIKADITNYTSRKKRVADNMIEYEYYNKYVLEKVAKCYFDDYMYYAHMYKNNFKNDEIAYTFYIGYAIKLTDRIIEVGSKNSVAKGLAQDIYESYIPELKKENEIIKSDMIGSAISDMEQKLENLKNIN